MDEPRLLTVHEVRERTGWSVSATYRRIYRGDLPAHQVQGRNVQYRVRPEDLDNYLAETGGRLTPPALDRSMMRVPEVAKTLGFSVETVRKMCYAGKLPFVRGHGDKGHLRIPRSAVEAFLAGEK